MKGCSLGGESFKVHLDGYNLMPFFKGEVKDSPRQEFLYWSDDGDLFAIRVKQCHTAGTNRRDGSGGLMRPTSRPSGSWMIANREPQKASCGACRLA